MEDVMEALTPIENRHRREKKELQAQIQAMKKTAKNDKTKKKELTAEIAKLESDMEIRHKKEVEINSDNCNFEPVLHSNLEVTKPKISKAQKRRVKKDMQEKERALQIKVQDEENIHGPRNLERLAICSKLRERNLVLYQIPSDGDCLYKAVAHQMLITREKNYPVVELRKSVSQYIKQNKDDFIPFMSNSDTFEMLTDAEFDEYCDNIQNTKAWGGQLEIRALSNSLHCPINVIQSTGPECIQQGTEFDGPPLIITYHRHMYSLGEHYNSTETFIEDIKTVSDK